MTSPEPNSVGRLQALLRAFQEAPANISNRQVLSGYLRLELRPSLQTFRALSAIVALPAEARAAFGRAQLNDTVPFEEAMRELDKAESAALEITNLDAPCQNVKAQFDVGTLMALRFIDKGVSFAEADKPLSDEQRENIRKAAVELINAVRAADSLPDYVKRILVEHAQAVITALMVVDLTGPEELLKERDRLAGHVRRQPGAFLDALRNTSVGKAFVGLSLALSAIAGVTNNAEQITDNVMKAVAAIEQQIHPVADNVQKPEAADPSPAAGSQSDTP